VRAKSGARRFGATGFLVSHPWRDDKWLHSFPLCGTGLNCLGRKRGGEKSGTKKKGPLEGRSLGCWLLPG